MIIVVGQTVGNEAAATIPLLYKPSFVGFICESIEVSNKPMHPQDPFEIHNHCGFFFVELERFQRVQANIRPTVKHKSGADHCVISGLRIICGTKIVTEDHLDTECSQFHWRPSRIFHENARLIDVVREDSGAGHAVNKVKLEFPPGEDGRLDSDHDAQLAFDMASVPYGGAPEPIRSNPQRQREDSDEYRGDSPQPFGGYLGKHRNPLKDDAIFGGAFIIGGVVFFVLLAFGIRELATGRDDERKLIDDNEAPKKCAEYERDSTESKSSTKPR
jgi:hypothetical protein